MITHKQSIAAQPVVASVDATVVQHGPSIAQTVDQVRADMPSSWQQSAMQTGLPNVASNVHTGQQTVEAHDPGNGGTDPSKASDTSASKLADIGGELSALRSSVLAGFDPTVDHDPTKGRGVDDLTGAGPSQDDFRAELSGGLHRPGDNESSTDSNSNSLSGSKDRHNVEESMFGADAGPVTASGTSLAPVTNNDEGVHAADGGKAAKDFGNGVLGKAAQSVVSPAGPGHDQLTYALDEIKSDSGGSATNNSANQGTAAGGSGTKPDTTSKDGTVTTTHNADGSTTVTDLGNHTVTRANKDGSFDTWKTDDAGVKKGDAEHTDAPKIPDGDHEGAPVDPMFNQLMQDAIKNQHSASHENDNKNIVGSDIPGTVSSADLNGGVVDIKGTLLSDNGTGFESPNHVGSGPGTQGQNPNQPTHDFGGPDDMSTSSSNGPEERSQPAVKTNVGSGQTGDHQSGGNQGSSGDQAHVVLAPGLETAVQNAEHRLLDVVGTSHDSGGNKTTQSVGDVHTGHDIASVLGSAVGGVTSGHDGGAFADLIRLANNPVQAALVPPPVAAGHDAIASLQLAALGDLAPHATDTSHVDHGHDAIAALPVAVHDDHSHLATPVLEHAHH